MTTQAFDPANYGTALEKLLREPRRNELGPGKRNEAARDSLERLTVERAFEGRQMVDASMARACLAGVWLYHDFLDESHRLSQEIETPTGSYWHGIMHRREPDYSNAKYWFRRVGQHEVFAALLTSARRIVGNDEPAELQRAVGGGDWDAMAFVDACQAGARGGGSLRANCEAIQQAEWELLFDYSYQHALKR